MKRLLVCVGLVLCVSGPALAQDSENSESASTATQTERVDESTLILGESTQEAGEGSTPAFGFWDLLQMIAVLGAVIGVIYLIFFLLKKAGNGRFTSSEQIKLLAAQNLPGNRSVYLIQVGAQVFMIGGGSDSVTMLSEITDADTVNALILAGGERAAATKKSFGEMIASLVQGSQGDSLDLMRRQRERLQKMGQ
ncbi:MAG: FliO/MopB family protein [Spirochaetales bacterium]